MKRKVITALPILFCIVILVYLWIKFETLKKEARNVDMKKVVENTQTFIERIHFVENFETSSKIGFTSSDEYFYEGKTSAFMADDNLYGPTYVSDSASLLKTTDEVEVSFLIYTEEEVQDLKFALSVGNEKDNFIYQAPIVAAIHETNVWVKRTMCFPIDRGLLASKKGAFELRAYLLNEGKSEFYLDHFEVKIKSLK